MTDCEMAACSAMAMPARSKIETKSLTPLTFSMRSGREARFDKCVGPEVRTSVAQSHEGDAVSISIVLSLCGPANRLACRPCKDRPVGGRRQVDYEGFCVRSTGSPDAVSWALDERTRRSMVSNRPRDTEPERRLRSALHRLGLRYRVNMRPEPGLRIRADMVFRRQRVCVFLDGCYWHGCTEHRSIPKTNTAFWQKKILGNRERDARIDHILQDAGWTVVRVWEHEPLEAAVNLVRLALG